MAAQSERELQLLKKRLHELAERSRCQNVFTFTGFLSLSEQELFWQTAGETGVWAAVSGGTEGTERQMGRFGSPEELGYEQPFPIACLRIEPLSEKFSDAFTHRDFLGAVMNLGIDRGTTGDILPEGKKAYLFCTETIAGYICGNLDRIKHTNVRCIPVTEEPAIVERRFCGREATVSSLRCDGVIASVWKLSRSQSLDLFRQKKIYINGRLTENNSYLLKPEDTVSVRGLGKFIFRGEKHQTKKGRLVIAVSVFV